MAATWILLCIVYYINAVSGQNVSSAAETAAGIVAGAATGKAGGVVAEAATGKAARIVAEAATGKAAGIVAGAATGKATRVVAEAATGKAAGTATKTASSVSASKPDCAPPLVCPPVKCLLSVTLPGNCCPVCLPDVIKPGKCPVPTGPGLCAQRCFGDFTCPGAMKCCSNGCGKACMIPKRNGKSCLYQGKRYEDGAKFKDRCNTCICNNGKVSCTEMACTSSKPGKCPETTGPGICILGCSSDWSCPDTQKCCGNGCGLLCTLPIGAVSSQPLCEGVFCPELYCDDQIIPPGKCCSECPITAPSNLLNSFA